MEPITDVREISRIGYGFAASKVLFAALNLDLFGRLSHNAKPLAALSEETGIAENQLLKLLTACVSLGLLAKEGERYANAPASETYLVRDAPAYFGDYFRFQIDRQLYPYMEHLEAALHGEDVPSFYDDVIQSDPDETEHFSQAQHVGSLGPAHVLAKRLDLSQCHRFLDVAGGNGAFTITFCHRYPEMQATILDFPPVVNIARRFVAEAQLEDRVSYVAGDAREVAWPDEQDAVLMSYLLSAVSERDTEALIKRAASVLKPGGLLILHDFMVEDDLSGPAIAALFLTMSIIGRPKSVALTPQFLTDLILPNCFEPVSVRDLVPGTTKVLVASRSSDCP